MFAILVVGVAWLKPTWLWHMGCFDRTAGISKFSVVESRLDGFTADDSRRYSKVCTNHPTRPLEDHGLE